MPDKLITNLIVDDRETEVNCELSKWNDVKLQVARIENGTDGIWDENFAWQRKRGDDLVSSITDGRMYDLTVQQQLYPFLVLIIEDKERAFAEGRLPEASIMGAIASAIYWKHCMTVYTRDFSQTALFIRIFGLQLVKENKNHPIIKSRPAETNEEKVLRVLQSLPGCGAEISIRIIAKCKTLWNFVNELGKTDVDIDSKTPKFRNTTLLTEIEKVGPLKCYSWKKVFGI